MKIIELRYWEVSACTQNFKEWLLNSLFAKHELLSFTNALKNSFVQSNFIKIEKVCFFLKLLK